jgi:hypothetical protein
MARIAPTRPATPHSTAAFLLDFSSEFFGN